MSRVLVKRGIQRKFMEEVKSKSQLTWEELAEVVNLSSRTLRDWRREVFKMNYEKAKILSEFTKVPLPKIEEILPEYWSVHKAAKAGGLAHKKLYGNPGTPEGRRKGGLRSQELRRLYPERYPKVSRRLFIRKEIKIPAYSTLLAEFVGIILGDGGITNHQVKVSLNYTRDAEYILYVNSLFKKLFSIVPVRMDNIKQNYTNIVASSINLVEFLEKIGLHRGNKVKQQVDIPKWVFKNEEWMKFCLRGLIDTDGNIARKNYHANTLAMQITFTNASDPLLKSVRRILVGLDYHPTEITRRQVHITRFKEVNRYIKEIGFSNSKHMKRFKKYVSMFDYKI
jgi:intein/homing endonuclease